MPVNTPHPEYAAALVDWQICRAVTSSARKLKNSPAIDRILPKLAGHEADPAAYDRYKERAYFFPACGRYIDGLLGMLCQSPPSITAGKEEGDGGAVKKMLDGIAKWAVDVTGAECSLLALRRFLTDEIARVGRVGVVIDYPVIEGRISVRQAELARLVPTVSVYCAENIISWEETQRGGRRILSRAVFEERYQARDRKDEFVIVQLKRWREWSFAENPQNGNQVNARVRVWVEDTEKAKSADNRAVVEQEYWPRYPDGAYLEELPVYIGGVNGIAVDITPPAVDDLVDVSVAHFRNSADLEHALIFAGHPLRWVTGYDPDKEEGIDPLGMTPDPERDSSTLVTGEYRSDLDDRVSAKLRSPTKAAWSVGSDKIWTIINHEAKLGSLAASAEEVGALVASMKAKEDHLVAIGGRILALDKQAAEAAQTEELRRSGERSIAQMLCDAVAEILTGVVRQAARWMGATAEQAVTLVVSGRVDVLQAMTATDAMGWSSLWQGRIIARSDLMLLLKRGGVIGQERDGEAIDAENEVDPPEMGGVEPVPASGSAAAAPPAT